MPYPEPPAANLPNGNAAARRHSEEALRSLNVARFGSPLKLLFVPTHSHLSHVSCVSLLSGTLASLDAEYLPLLSGPRFVGPSESIDDHISCTGTEPESRV